MAYQPSAIEPKWQKHWLKNNTFQAITLDSKPKYYILDMFPYPSSSGLHVGHPEGYTATDIIARYKRAKGYNVLHPMGWDAFGLPAEQYAIQTGVHPAITTGKAIENFRKQLQSLGFSYDWNREISTCDPQYYRWTQFLFLKLFERGLAYQKEVPVNWCPELKTVLANEEVVDGKSERGGHPVFRVPMKQWMLKITDYAERLLNDLDKVDWPEGTKELQRNWIGRSEGLQLQFEIQNHPGRKIEAFTTRPDTLFGATFLVLAPEHPMVSEIASQLQAEAVVQYQNLAAQKSEIARQDQSKEKSGVFTGAYAINPATEKPVPIWISDYVLMGYGTGAIMAVPAHDERDFEFAKQFEIEIVEVVKAVVEEKTGEAKNQKDAGVSFCFSGEGVNCNSGFIDGMPTAKAKAAVIQWAEKKGIGTRKIQYKLRDWLFSRQRYWGEPFPILKDSDGRLQAVSSQDLPVALPAVESYEPTGTGESPLGAITSWVEVPTKDGKKWRRETDTMPGSAGSSWYFLRFCDPQNDQAPFSKAAIDYWMPVDFYLGGDEHAVGHLLYSRFWTKVLHDAGLISVDEPFSKLFHQGMILGEDGEKMSKSRGNVINPDTVVSEYGADTLRLYEMFMGPLDKDKPWSSKAIEGVSRFLHRTYRLFFEEGKTDPKTGKTIPDRFLISDTEPTEADKKILHQTIKKVTEDIEGLRFNTAISQMMVFVNYATGLKERPRALLKPFIQLLHPFAPHLAEELWEAVALQENASQNKPELSFVPWPTYDPALTVAENVTIAVQVLGKTRATLEVGLDVSQDEVEKLARENSSVANQLAGKTIVKVIYVPKRILNFVVK